VPRLFALQLRVTFLAALVAAGLIFAPSALAHRKVTGGVAAAMRSAVVQHLGKPSCTGKDTLRIVGTSLSTANSQYGLVLTADNSCTYSFGYFVQRSTSSSKWHVVAAVNDSTQDCSYFTRRLPGAVVTDYELKGLSGSLFGTCVTAFTVPVMPTVLGPPDETSMKARPRKLIYTGDSSGFYGGAGKPGKFNAAGPLNWSQWTHTEAVASANDWQNNCSPNCATGTFKPYPITLKLTRPGRLDGYFVYTRITVTYKAKLPPSEKHRTLHFPVMYMPGVDGFSF
jgi:hypothetical protein